MTVFNFSKGGKIVVFFVPPCEKTMRVLSSGVFEELSVVDIVPSLSWQKRYNYNEEVLLGAKLPAVVKRSFVRTTPSGHRRILF